MSNVSNYEIDFLPVGNGDKSGDAIAVRYGTQGNYKVMVVDGGTKESGQALVEHIKKYYQTDYVDYVVNTHPDQDHASGLTEVLENLKVGELWIHKPWEYIEYIIDYIKQNPHLNIDGRITEKSLKKRFENEYYKYAKKLEYIANKRGIAIKEPYQGCKIGDFTVLSPNKDWYLQDLIPNSTKTKEISTQDFKISFIQSAKEILYNISEKLLGETLRDGGETSRENESSVVLYANFDNQGILLTGDAGNEALQNAYDFAIENGVDISQKLKFIQIPHHGSRRNVSPNILNQLIGDIDEKDENSIIAFVSAGKDDANHPRRVVTNAFIRRGCKVIETKGSTKHHHRNMPEREGWTTATPMPFYDKVESYE